MCERENAILVSIHDMFEVSAYAVDPSGNIQLKQCAVLGMDVIGNDNALCHRLIDVCPEPGSAYVYYDAPKFYYLLYRTDNLIFIFGPACANEPGRREKEAYINEHPTGKQNNSIPVVEEQKMRSAVNLFRMVYGDYSCTWIRHERAKRPALSHDVVNYRFEKFRADYQHTPFSVQKEWMDAIRAGNADKLFKISEMTNPDNIGILAETDLKQAEYRTIVSIVIANLAAIEGGVDSAQAYELSDIFLQRLEKCNSIAKFDEVTRDATLAYVKLVKNKKNSATNYHVSRCKDYISAHIQENIKVSTLAECAGLDESYLGRLFKESEGISIKKYIHQKKMEVAAEMLVYSDASVAEISDFLGFHSKSYFGEIFLRTYQMTPLNYRTTNRAI